MKQKIQNAMNSNNNHSPIISNQSSVISQSSDLDYLVEVICASGIDIAPTYDEYTNLAFAIATDYGEAGRWAFHAICKLSQKYNETHADKMYSGAIVSNKGVKHIASAFYLAKQAGVNIDDVRLKRAEDRQKQREKCSNVQIFTGDTFPHVGTRDHYYIREKTVNDATNTDNTNIDCDDEAFENMPDNGKEPVSDNPEPYKPLPLLFDDYKWPKPLDEILTFAETKHQRDALFLGMVDAIGSTLSPYVRTMYSQLWMYPNLQVFVVAPPASGKGVVSWCRNFVEPQHERLRSAYRKEMKAYEKEKRIQEQMGRAKAQVEAPQLPVNKMFLISGDNSSTGIAQNVIDSDGRGIIIETEADTLSAALGADYGRWSHMLRNFFDHSRISYNRRLDREYMEISRTMVSVLLAGTPAQVAPLIPSSENGLFSRVLFYYMPAVREWRTQFGASSIDITSAMVSRGRQWMETCDEISKLGGISFVLSKEQQSLFDDCFRKLFARCMKSNELCMSASLVRLAVNIIRIMSVIAVLRRIEQCGVSFAPAADTTSENIKDGIISSCEVCISNDDFEACLSLAEPLYLHATHIISFIEHNEVKNKNISDRERLLDMMDDEFSRSQWLDKVEVMGVPLNTANTWLRRLIKSGVVVKGEKRGTYKKSFYI